MSLSLHLFISLTHILAVVTLLRRELKKIKEKKKREKIQGKDEWEDEKAVRRTAAAQEKKEGKKKKKNTSTMELFHTDAILLHLLTADYTSCLSISRTADSSHSSNLHHHYLKKSPNSASCVS